MKISRHGFLLFNGVVLVSTLLAMTRLPNLTDLSAERIVLQPIAQPEIDLITIKTLIRQVNTLEIQPLGFVTRVDSVVANVAPEKVRNPFAVAVDPVPPPPKPKPKPQKTTTTPKPKPKPKPKIVRPSVTINGIVWDIQEPYAIMNGELYRVGDDFNGYTVYAILDTTVVLKNDRDKYVVNYHEE
ncbi:MAG: hypothetical protein K9N11_08800 [Lentisphaeria bacterium]|nr:hypothetical protein [Candidatus Neomarinimicrobiota bacterium]MCF7842935.1 hypothetical protein [Lentisphaeria bacterium]